jgi:hypothetical protein
MLGVTSISTTGGKVYAGEAEVLVAMACDGRDYIISDQSLLTRTTGAPSGLNALVNEQAAISWAASTNTITYGTQAYLDPTYWDSDGNLKASVLDDPNTFYTAIYQAAFSKDPTKHARLACQAAAELIQLAGLTVYLKMCGPTVFAAFVNAVRDETCGEVLGSKQLLVRGIMGMQFRGLPPLNTVPGDWGWIHNPVSIDGNPDVEDGYEGSNTVAIGTNPNAEFWWSAYADGGADGLRRATLPTKFKHVLGYQGKASKFPNGRIDLPAVTRNHLDSPNAAGLTELQRKQIQDTLRQLYGNDNFWKAHRDELFFFPGVSIEWKTRIHK